MTKILQKKLLIAALCFLWATVLWGQVSIPTQGTAVVTNFSGWNGTLPAGYSKSGSGNAPNYVGTSVNTTGGVYAVSGSGFGYRPSSSAAALQLLGSYQNDTGAPITQLQVTYDAFRIAHADSRLPGWAVTYNGTAVSQLGWAYDINKTATSPAVLTYTFSVSIPAGTTFSLAFNSDRGAGSGSSPLIGLNNVSVKAIPAAPAAPVATAATTLTSAGFTANWNAVAGATSYELDVSADPAFSTMLPDYNSLVVTGVSQYVITGIQSGITYYYRVRADNGTLISTNSNVIQVAVPCGVVALPTAAVAQVFCGEATVSQLVATPATGGTINWYGDPEGGLPIPGNIALAPATYYVGQTINGCESARVAVAVTINELPAAPTAAAQTFCGATAVQQLQATGTDIKWYAAQTGDTALEATATVTSGTYYASQTVNGCESTRVASAIVVNEIPAASTAAAQTFCGATTVAGLQATGTAVAWYTAQTGGTALEATAAVTTNTYYVSQTVNGCESSRTAVAITVNEIPAAPTAAAQAFCGGGTVSQLAVTAGTAPKWFAAETGGTELAGTEALTTATYYVSQTVNGCESPRAAVAVTVNAIPVAPVVATQTFCGPATVAALTVTTGTAPKYYTALTGGTALETTAALATGIYYASQTVNGCEGPRAAFVVIINPVPAAPVAAAQAFCGSATVSQLEATAVGAQWYAAQTGGTALEGTVALATGTYYVSQIVNGCESARTAVTVTVNEIPVAPTAAAQTFCGAATVSQLAVTTGANIQWYAAATGGTALNGATGLSTGSYYASQTVNGCESPRVAVAVTVNAIPAAPAVADNTIELCNSATVANLTATGENIAWYSAPTGGTALEATTVIAPGLTVYYASQTVNGCESARTALAVTLNVTAAPVVAAQTFCNAATAEELIAEGENIQWYAAETGGDALEATAALATNTYYVSQTLNGCESPRAAVEITVNVVTAPTAAAQTFCEAGTVADLEVTTGENIQWYAAETGGDALEATTALAAGTYYASQTVNECEGPRVAVEVTITTTVAPVGASNQDFEEGSGDTLADLEVTGTGIVWYADEALTTVLPADTVLEDDTTYYAVSVVGECTSSALAVTANETLGTEVAELNKLVAYPNPVSDKLYFEGVAEVTTVEVYNMIGQPVLVMEPKATRFAVDMAHLAAGNYIVKAYTQSGIKTVKVVKQ